jgi:hypothetical protein
MMQYLGAAFFTAFSRRQNQRITILTVHDFESISWNLLLVLQRLERFERFERLEPPQPLIRDSRSSCQEQANRLLKKPHRLRCARSPRSNVTRKYASARRFLARLASEIF